MNLRPNERIIVALDVEHVSHARQIYEDLAGEVCWYKIGPHFYLDEEFSRFLYDLLESGLNGLFIDFKHLDTDKTVRMAIRQARRRGIHFVTVHAHKPLMKAAAEEAEHSEVNVLAVPLLTTFGRAELLEFYNYPGLTMEFMAERVQWAIESGCKGTVCSPMEVFSLRAMVPDDFLLVVPGIRPSGSEVGDHKRLGTPRQAINDGADLLVIGGPIVEADNPLDAFHRIVDEIA